MGVKSTTRLTRSEAIERGFELWAETMKRPVKAALHSMTNSELEEKLEEMKDEAAGGEGFENFSIVGDDS